MRPGVVVECCQRGISAAESGEHCECKVETDFDFVVMLGDTAELKQKNQQLMEQEFARLFNISADSVWRFTYVNNSQNLCNTYPKVLVTHRSITDEALTKDSSFRKKGRFPSPVWLCKATGATLIRGSQPDTVTGLYGGDGVQTDEENLQFLFSTSDKPPLIVDCRPHTNAFVNLFNHGGTETLLYTYEVQFANIANVQGVAHSLNVLVEQDSPDLWMKNLDSIIKAAVTVATRIKEGCSVFVHCSDGWDRTSQVSSLAQLLLDPCYRTIEGFYTLVEKEWVHFGHMFSLRTDEGKLKSSNPEWSPIFAQWLNIVWCFLHKSPTAFEFNSSLLEQLLENTYSPKLYSGTIMPNLWDSMNSSCSRKAFRNCEYNSSPVLQWECTPVDRLWDALYFKFSLPYVERKIRQRVGLGGDSESNFSEILSRFVKDTVHFLHEDKGENRAVPQQFAAYMNFLIEGKADDSNFWLKVAKEGQDSLASRQGLLHAHFEVTDSRECRRFQSYNLFKTRKDAETSLDVEKQFIQERGLSEHLVLEATQIIPI